MFIAFSQTFMLCLHYAEMLYIFFSHINNVCGQDLNVSFEKFSIYYLGYFRPIIPSPGSSRQGPWIYFQQSLHRNQRAHCSLRNMVSDGVLSGWVLY